MIGPFEILMIVLAAIPVLALGQRARARKREFEGEDR